MDMLKKVPVREQDPKVRAANFKEVCLGYDMEDAMDEASRCLKCKNAKCMTGCPVSIDIPGFIKEVEEGISRKQQRSSQDHLLFRQFAAVYVHRKASAKASVSAVSRGNRFPSGSWNALWRIGPGSMVLCRRPRQ